MKTNFILLFSFAQKMHTKFTLDYHYICVLEYRLKRYTGKYEGSTTYIYERNGIAMWMK